MGKKTQKSAKKIDTEPIPEENVLPQLEIDY